MVQASDFSQLNHLSQFRSLHRPRLGGVRVTVTFQSVGITEIRGTSCFLGGHTLLGGSLVHAGLGDQLAALALLPFPISAHFTRGWQNAGRIGRVRGKSATSNNLR
jgi:hypothetical protein